MKFLKTLFTVPEGQKVTDRMFKRVLISSVCGILVCMTCLMSTTWAWFTATIETAEIPIEVASHKAEVYLDGGDSPHTGTDMIKLEVKQPRTIKVDFITNATTDTEVSYTPNRYIVMSVYKEATTLAEDGETRTTSMAYAGAYCFAATYDETEKIWSVQLKLETGEDCQLAFNSAWQIPSGLSVSAMPEQGNFVVINAEKTADETSAPATSEPAVTESKPVESKPVESTPAESKPVESTTAATEAKTE